jgi:hypothetical protein
MNLRFLICLLCLVTQGLVSQNDLSQTLFSIDDATITNEEFLRVYNKNLELVKDDAL